MAVLPLSDAAAAPVLTAPVTAVPAMAATACTPLLTMPVAEASALAVTSAATAQPKKPCAVSPKINLVRMCRHPCGAKPPCQIAAQPCSQYLSHRQPHNDHTAKCASTNALRSPGRRGCHPQSLPQFHSQDQQNKRQRSSPRKNRCPRHSTCIRRNVTVC